MTPCDRPRIDLPVEPTLPGSLWEVPTIWVLKVSRVVVGSPSGRLRGKRIVKGYRRLPASHDLDTKIFLKLCFDLW